MVGRGSCSSRRRRRSSSHPSCIDKQQLKHDRDPEAGQRQPPTEKTRSKYIRPGTKVKPGAHAQRHAEKTYIANEHKLNGSGLSAAAGRCPPPWGGARRRFHFEIARAGPRLK